MSEQTPVTDQAQQAASSTPQEASTAPAGEETTNAPPRLPPLRAKLLVLLIPPLPIRLARRKLSLVRQLPSRPRLR